MRSASQEASIFLHATGSWRKGIVENEKGEEGVNKT